MLETGVIFAAFFQDITSFEKKYKKSEEESEDLKSAYIEYEGDMDKILEEV